MLISLVKAVSKTLLQEWIAIFGSSLTGVVYGLILLDASLASSNTDVEARSGSIEYWAKMSQGQYRNRRTYAGQFGFQETFSVNDRVQRWLVLIILPISLGIGVLQKSSSNGSNLPRMIANTGNLQGMKLKILSKKI